MITFLKPENWMELPMFKKIYYYGTQLTKEYTEYVDKLQAKNKVKEICGDDIQVAKVVRVLDSYYDITLDDLNTNYIIKSSHGSGWNIYNDADTFNEDVVGRQGTSCDYAIRILQAWNRNYGSTLEKQYSFIEPKFFIEEKICDSILGYTGYACVYMFRCIHSNPISISVKYKNKQNSYDINWNLTQNPYLPFEIPKPKCLQKLLNLCKILSANFEFVRLDFYIGKDDIIYFSEFTFTPAAGNQVFDDKTEMDQGLLWV